MVRKPLTIGPLAVLIHQETRHHIFERQIRAAERRGFIKPDRIGMIRIYDGAKLDAIIASLRRAGYLPAEQEAVQA
jgi:hypothetical protein